MSKNTTVYVSEYISGIAPQLDVGCGKRRLAIIFANTERINL